jgi:nucleoside-diphosphate kinase
MSARTDDSLLFVVEWYDPLPQIKKQYLLKYFPDQNMVEMVDVKSKKIFLRKCFCPETLTKEDFYIGSKILLYSRELDIVDYGDLRTKDKLAYQIQTTILLLPSNSYSYWGRILDELLNTSQSKLTIINMRSFLFSNNSSISKILSLVDRDPSRERDMITSLSENIVLGMLINGENAFDVVSTILVKFQSQIDSNISYLMSMNGLQTSSLQNYLFSSDSLSLFPTTVTMDNSTCVVIKPHAVKSRIYGSILQHVIDQGYEISAIRSIQFDKTQAEEFLEVYKGVIPEYTDHTIQLSSGISIALEVRAQNAVETFRVSAGPWDVDMAKDLRPDTIRAKYGKDRILNAIHCTDLPEDAELECEYCFKLL